MASRSGANLLIQKLETGGLYADCPACGEGFRLRDAGLFYLGDFSPKAEAIYKQRVLELRERGQELKQRRRTIPETSERTSQAVNVGFILERLAPTMRGFGFEPGDCRPLGDPIDYIVFEGLDRTRKVKRVVFSDIKTGKARLTEGQKQIRSVVERKQVTLTTYPSREGTK